MKKTWSSFATVTSAPAALVLLAAFATQKGAAPAGLPIAGKTLIATSELKWAALPGIPGAELARLFG